MTQPKAPTNLTIVLSLALIATPLTIDQRGGFRVEPSLGTKRECPAATFLALNPAAKVR